VNSDPSDVPQLTVVEFEPPETQAVSGRVELGEPLPVAGAESIALGPGLRCPAYQSRP
jgi:hypothetical protein